MQSMLSERCLNTTRNCLERYKLVLRTPLPTQAVRYLVRTRAISKVFGLDILNNTIFTIYMSVKRSLLSLITDVDMTS